MTIAAVRNPCSEISLLLEGMVSTLALDAALQKQRPDGPGERRQQHAESLARGKTARAGSALVPSGRPAL